MQTSKASDLRKRMTMIARNIRKPTLDNEDFNLPQSVKSDTILFDGRLVRRKRIVLLTTGCVVKSCSMCPFPNEAIQGINAENLLKQFESSFTEDCVNDYDMITIFCNGNYFNDSEIPVSVRDNIFNAIKNSSVKYIKVESLPQYVTADKIQHVKSIIGSKKLVVFMGYQSNDDTIRNLAINTTCTRHSFEQTCSNLIANDFIPVSFVMIKPPFVTESEAVDDAVNTIRYLAFIGVKHATLCPMRVAPFTIAEILHKQGKYQPPKLWTVVSILRKCHDIDGITAMVNTSELKAHMNTDSVCAEHDCECRNEIITSIEKYLYSRDVSVLDSLDCECYLSLHPWFEDDNDSVEDRIESFVNSMEG